MLVMDVARFKYPPFWVPVEALWDSMEVLDRVTGMPRGYFIVSTERHESGAATAAPGVGKEEHVCGHDHSVIKDEHACLIGSNSSTALHSQSNLSTALHSHAVEDSASGVRPGSGDSQGGSAVYYTPITEAHPTMTCPPGILGWGSAVDGFN